MPFARTTAVALLAATLASVPAAAVTTTTFTGQDDGAAVGGPFPNSAAAEAAFKAAAAAYGKVKTETLESATVGTLSPLVLADLTITTSAPDFGSDLSGINNTTLGSLYGFNVTPGGSNWYGFPNFTATSAIFTFDTPTNSMGLWITGIQSIFTASLSVELIDGSQEVFALPINTSGGAQFFGVVSSLAFSKVLALQTNNPGVADAFGIDDISYNGVIPEPATWAMLIAGFGLVGAAARRRRGQRAGTVTA
jgi:hypothetical protein